MIGLDTLLTNNSFIEEKDIILFKYLCTFSLTFKQLASLSWNDISKNTGAIAYKHDSKNLIEGLYFYYLYGLSYDIHITHVGLDSIRLKNHEYSYLAETFLTVPIIKGEGECSVFEQPVYINSIAYNISIITVDTFKKFDKRWLKKIGFNLKFDSFPME